MRLFYVAATRARDHLLVSLFHPTKGAAAKSRAAEMYKLAQQRPELWHPVEPSTAPAAALSAAPARVLDTAAERNGLV